MIAADKISPFGFRRVVATEAGIPDAIEVGYKSVGDVRIAENESSFLDNCLHGRYEG